MPLQRSKTWVLKWSLLPKKHQLLIPTSCGNKCRCQAKKFKRATQLRSSTTLQTRQWLYLIWLVSPLNKHEPRCSILVSQSESLLRRTTQLLRPTPSSLQFLKPANKFWVEQQLTFLSVKEAVLLKSPTFKVKQHKRRVLFLKVSRSNS